MTAARRRRPLPPIEGGVRLDRGVGPAAHRNDPAEPAAAPPPEPAPAAPDTAAEPPKPAPPPQTPDTPQRTPHGPSGPRMAGMAVRTWRGRLQPAAGKLRAARDETADAEAEWAWLIQEAAEAGVHRDLALAQLLDAGMSEEDAQTYIRGLPDRRSPDLTPEDENHWRWMCRNTAGRLAATRTRLASAESRWRWLADKATREGVPRHALLAALLNARMSRDDAATYLP